MSGCSSWDTDDAAVVELDGSCTAKAFNLEDLCDWEVDLLTKAAKDPAAQADNLDGINKRFLMKLAENQGLDYATGVFFQRLNREAHSRKYMDQIFKNIEEIKKSGLEKYIKFKKKPLLAMVPAPWYDSKTAVGGDGADIRNAARSIGIEEELVKVKPDGTVNENADFICDWLEKNHTGRKILLASISKGALDIKRAIQVCGTAPAFKRVVGWLNVGGVYRGSYLTNEIDGFCLYRWRARSWFEKNNYSYQSFLDIRVDETSPLYKDQTNPPGVQIVNVIATPIYRYITERAQKGYSVLSKYGPNDGLTVLADSYIPGAYNISLWGTDHYFSVAAKRNLLLYAALMEFLKANK